NDDSAPTEPGSLPPTPFRFEKIGRAPLSLQRICDLRSFGDDLYAAHANQPLGTDGATISRFRWVDGRPLFSVAFDWNRPGEPVRGGGAGQGFLRVRAIDGRLFVPDADPPYAGFGIADRGTEGYVFVSDGRGRFAPASSPGHRPPPSPKKAASTLEADGGELQDGRAGAGVVPRAYHDIDVIRYRGHVYVSTGSVPPTERAWHGASPGALHVADPSWSRWSYCAEYPFPWQEGVWRLTFLVRYRGRLFAGIQDFDGREKNDYVVFSGHSGDQPLSREDGRGVRVTTAGGALTLRWFADAGRLWWVALEKDGAVTLRVSDDGEAWHDIDLPANAGRPSDVARFHDAIVALTERGLWRVDVSPAAELARVDEKATPFAVSDAFCAAPLAVYRGGLYAGGQRDGALWRVRSSQ
ncbi:MAG: hypothetical protein M3O50_18490, partial [Myxococcota bacterium]|nr:hypothetical protein [Myxococcota bacterium]